ncbi:helicase, partial [Mortierella sp. AM989]
MQKKAAPSQIHKRISQVHPSTGDNQPQSETKIDDTPVPDFSNGQPLNNSAGDATSSQPTANPRYTAKMKKFKSPMRLSSVPPTRKPINSPMSPSPSLETNKRTSESNAPLPRKHIKLAGNALPKPSLTFSKPKLHSDAIFKTPVTDSVGCSGEEREEERCYNVLCIAKGIKVATRIKDGDELSFGGKDIEETIDRGTHLRVANGYGNKRQPGDIGLVDVVVDPLLGQHLRPHQKEGIQFLYECVMQMRDISGQGAILADEMGLGKTLQTIALLWTLLKQSPYYGEESSVVKRALVVCPASLIKNWQMEFKKWLGTERLRVFAVDSKSTLTDFTLGKIYPVMIIGYEKLRIVQDELKNANFDIIICDEGHRLKTANIKTSQAIRSLPTKRRIILSGTPIQNDLCEFFSMIDFVNPGLFENYGSFKRVFEDPISKSESEPQGLYSGVKYLIQSICGDLEDSSISGKLNFVDALLKSIKGDTTERVVLVSNFTQTLDILENLCNRCNYGYFRLDGSTPTHKRQEFVDKFNTISCQKYVFLLSAKSGGLGLNLIGASRLILFDIDWNPSVDLQAMARIHRDGQTRPVFIYRLLLSGTIEEKMYQRQLTKVGLSDALMDGKASEMLNKFSAAELRDLFTLHEDEPCLTHSLLGCDCNVEGKDHGDKVTPDQRMGQVLNKAVRATKSSIMDEASVSLARKELEEWTHIDVHRWRRSVSEGVEVDDDGDAGSSFRELSHKDRILWNTIVGREESVKEETPSPVTFIFFKTFFTEDSKNEQHAATVRDLIGWMTKSLLKERPELFVGDDGSVRSGILVLINGADWELEGELDTNQLGQHNALDSITTSAGAPTTTATTTTTPAITASISQANFNGPSVSSAPTSTAMTIDGYRVHPSALAASPPTPAKNMTAVAATQHAAALAANDSMRSSMQGNNAQGAVDNLSSSNSSSGVIREIVQRLMPLGLALVMGYISYIYIFHVCIDYILRVQHRPVQAGIYLG